MANRRGQVDEDDEETVLNLEKPTVAPVASIPVAQAAQPIAAPTPAAADPQKAASSFPVDSIFELNFDTLTLAEVNDILKKCNKSQVEEVLSHQEQQLLSQVNNERASRPELFGDDVDGTTGYHYAQMLSDIFQVLQKRHGGISNTSNPIITPILEKMGKTKTVITNFGRICRSIGRPVESVKEFIETEISATSNLTGDEALILKFQTRKANDFDNVLKKYLDKWVICNSCYTINTTLHHKDRLYELVCNNCQATRTIQKEKKETAANTEKRSKRNQAL